MRGGVGLPHRKMQGIFSLDMREKGARDPGGSGVGRRVDKFSGNGLMHNTRKQSLVNELKDLGIRLGKDGVRESRRVEQPCQVTHSSMGWQREGG